MTTVACPRCGKPLRLPDRRAAGQRFACPHCRQPFALNGADDQPHAPREQSQPEQKQSSGPLPPDWISLDPPLDAARETASETLKLSSLENLSALGVRDGLHGLAARRLATRKRRRELFRLIVPAAVAVAVGFVAVIFGWNAFTHRGSPVPNHGTGSLPVVPVSQQHAANGQEQSQQSERPTVAVPQRQPIRLLLAPAGVRMIVDLRPDKLWGADAKAAQPSRGEELRRCLGSLATWTERQMTDWCLFPPSQIDEVLFSFVLRSPGDPPDVTATVSLKQATTIAEIAHRFGDTPRKQGALSVCVKGDRALVIRDGKTFAVGPQATVQEIVDANEQPNPTDESIEELLKETDRSLAITVVFRPDDLDRFRESLFPPTLQNVAHRVAGWLDPDATEGAAISFQLADPFRIRLALRNRPATTVTHLSADVLQRIEQLPLSVLTDIEHLDPKTSGRRKLLGRVPAMWKAVALGTEATTQTRLVIFESVLPERAAPNLSLGTYLALTENSAAGSGSKNGRGRQTSPAGEAKTIAQRLATKVNIDFRRTPLSDAFASLGEDIGVAFEVDGGAFKLAGYTKNMPQTLQVSGVAATEALRQMLKPYAKMVLIVDAVRQKVIVTTREAADAKGQQPLRLE